MLSRTILMGLSGIALAVSLYACGSNDVSPPPPPSVQDQLTTSTPIKHVVVIYNENVSFDHYFATYPNATNPSGEPAFTAAAGTPTVNGLSGSLLTNNPNLINTLNGTGAANPFRLDRTQAATADQNHAYTAEQQADDNGAADLFPLGIPVKGRAVAQGHSERMARSWATSTATP